MFYCLFIYLFANIKNHTKAYQLIFLKRKKMNWFSSELKLAYKIIHD